MPHPTTAARRSWQVPVAVLVAVVLAVVVMGRAAEADHEGLSANKFAVSGSAIDDIGPDDEHVILSQTMRVSSNIDLALSATVECSILTYLRSAGGPDVVSDTSRSEGRVELWITIDGRRVPVQTTGYDDPLTAEEENGADNGEVTFCNREYERTIIDMEDDGDGPDGIDEERDFIRTRNANAFNWFALDVGSEYDDPALPAGAGNNVVLIELWARYTKEGAQPCVAATVFSGDPQEDCSDAFVGKRTLVAEPTNASVHMQ